MRYLICYDIPDDRRRLAVSKILEDFGDRVQWSVFECLMDSGLLPSLLKRLEQVVEPKEDTVRVYFLCGRCEMETVILGRGELLEEPEVYIV